MMINFFKLTKFTELYRNIYKLICGHHPYVLPWHFQWLATFYLHKRLSNLLPNYGGKVLDVGCGNKPYQNWFGFLIEYTGIDIAPGPLVDKMIQENKQWPLLDNSYNVLISTQVIEHTENLELTLNEMRRVLKDGGVIILSFPFLYNVHGAPNDYRRYTHFGANKLLEDFEVIHLEKLGGIGSTLVILFLNWIEIALSYNIITKLLKVLLLPLFIIISLILNMLGLLLDTVDNTNAFYSNILMVARKNKN